MKHQIETLENAIKVIENWKWNMYQDDDEVGIAMQSIKDAVKQLKLKNKRDEK